MKVDGIGHRFGERWLFRNVSLSIPRSSIAVTGPSGVGKTTLLSIIGGLLRPSEGQIRLRKEGHSEPAIGWVFQTANAFPNRTTQANLETPLVLSGWHPHKARTRAVQMANYVGLGDRIDTAARKLSGGELQRLAIARAVGPQPSLILADEPTGQLDDHSSQTIIELLIDSRAPESAILVATHDRMVSDRCEIEYRLTSTGIERVR